MAYQKNVANDNSHKSQTWLLDCHQTMQYHLVKTKKKHNKSICIFFSVLILFLKPKINAYLFELNFFGII